MACFSTVRGTRMRTTLTDECGVPSTGAGDSAVTDGFVSVSFSPENEDRDEILLKNAAGLPCVSATTAPQLKWYNVEIEFCKVDPELFALITGQTLVDDYGSDPVGISIGDSVVDTGFALETWTEIPGQACTTGAQSHGYFLAPWITEAVFDDFSIENDALTFTISGRTNSQHAWGAGPYDVVPSDAGNTPAPLLTPLDPSIHLHMQLTTIDPPASDC